MGEEKWKKYKHYERNVERKRAQKERGVRDGDGDGDRGSRERSPRERVRSRSRSPQRSSRERQSRRSRRFFYFYFDVYYNIIIYTVYVILNDKLFVPENLMEKFLAEV